MRKKLTGIIVLMFFMVFALQIPVFAVEDQSETLQLNMEDSVSRALRCSNTLESAQLDVDIAEQNKGDLAGVWHPSFITDYSAGAESGDYNGDGIPDGPNLYTAMPALDFKLDAARKSETIAKDQVVYDTYSKYYDVLTAVEALDAAEKSYAAAEKTFEIKKLYLEVGMLSMLEYQSAVMNFATAQSSLVSAQSDLENAYIAFNQQIGLDTSDRPVLTDLPVFTNLELTNLDSTVRSIVSSSPTQWLAEEGSKLQYRLSRTPGSTDQDEIGADQADLDADSAYDMTIKAVYQMYYGIKGMEEGYQVAQSGLTLAETAYDLAQLQYEIGMGTQADVLSAEASLAEAQKGLLSLTCKHNLLKIAFEKPWCAGSAMGSSSSTSSSGM